MPRGVKSDEVVCPHCDTVQTDDSMDHISYWGGTTVGWSCEYCSKMFSAIETVTREFESVKDADK